MDGRGPRDPLCRRGDRGGGSARGGLGATGAGAEAGKGFARGRRGDRRPGLRWAANRPGPRGRGLSTRGGGRGRSQGLGVGGAIAAGRGAGAGVGHSAVEVGAIPSVARVSRCWCSRSDWNACLGPVLPLEELPVQLARLLAHPLERDQIFLEDAERLDQVGRRTGPRTGAGSRTGDCGWWRVRSGRCFGPFRPGWMVRFGGRAPGVGAGRSSGSGFNLGRRSGAGAGGARARAGAGRLGRSWRRRP